MDSTSASEEGAEYRTMAMNPTQAAAAEDEFSRQIVQQAVAAMRGEMGDTMVQVCSELSDEVSRLVEERLQEAEKKHVNAAEEIATRIQQEFAEEMKPVLTGLEGDIASFASKYAELACKNETVLIEMSELRAKVEDLQVQVAKKSDQQSHDESVLVQTVADLSHKVEALQAARDSESDLRRKLEQQQGSKDESVLAQLAELRQSLEEQKMNRTEIADLRRQFEGLQSQRSSPVPDALADSQAQIQAVCSRSAEEPKEAINNLADLMQCGLMAIEKRCQDAEDSARIAQEGLEERLRPMQAQIESLCLLRSELPKEMAELVAKVDTAQQKSRSAVTASKAGDDAFNGSTVETTAGESPTDSNLVKALADNLAELKIEVMNCVQNGSNQRAQLTCMEDCLNAVAYRLDKLPVRSERSCSEQTLQEDAEASPATGKREVVPKLDISKVLRETAQKENTPSVQTTNKTEPMTNREISKDVFFAPAKGDPAPTEGVADEQQPPEQPPVAFAAASPGSATVPLDVLERSCKAASPLMRHEGGPPTLVSGIPAVPAVGAPPSLAAPPPLLAAHALQPKPTPCASIRQTSPSAPRAAQPPVVKSVILPSPQMAPCAVPTIATIATATQAPCAVPTIGSFGPCSMPTQQGIRQDNCCFAENGTMRSMTITQGEDGLPRFQTEDLDDCQSGVFTTVGDAPIGLSVKSRDSDSDSDESTPSTPKKAMREEIASFAPPPMPPSVPGSLSLPPAGMACSQPGPCPPGMMCAPMVGGLMISPRVMVSPRCSMPNSPRHAGNRMVPRLSLSQAQTPQLLPRATQAPAQAAEVGRPPVQPVPVLHPFNSYAPPVHQQLSAQQSPRYGYVAPGPSYQNAPQHTPRDSPRRIMRPAVAAPEVAQPPLSARTHAQ
jgi:hypothetical protein